ncbi:MAG: acetyl-CoA carboxylase, carboxyltransferase subunit beta [Firmicutes bacterium]|nr:acetyl-CoA carboxylase, carboxyltransferase subunit beta [Bacillota bacterium]
MAVLKFSNKPKNELEKSKGAVPMPQAQKEPVVNCPNCHKDIPRSRLSNNLLVCTCGYHFRMSARRRINAIVDKGTFVEHDATLISSDVLEFPGYKQKLFVTREHSNEVEGVVTGTAKIGGEECCIFVMEPSFMMGSMGTAVGEKITRIFEYATEKKMSVVGFTVSGGARMQEGLLSLMQMAKTSGAVKRHSLEGLFYLTILTDPTTGGVTASFAMEGDIILAEPGATVGFAGARVIEQTTREKLPWGFQKSEFLLEHGFVDAIVPRGKQKEKISYLLRIHKGGVDCGC